MAEKYFFAEMAEARQMHNTLLLNYQEDFISTGIRFLLKHFMLTHRMLLLLRMIMGSMKFLPGLYWPWEVKMIYLLDLVLQEIQIIF